MYLEIKNSKDNRLGLPLPKGKVRVYKADTSGSQQLIGEDWIDHTPNLPSPTRKLTPSRCASARPLPRTAKPSSPTACGSGSNHGDGGVPTSSR